LIGTSVHRPHPHVFFADKQALALVVGHAAFRLAVDLELAHQLTLHTAIRGAQAVLQEGAVLAVGDGIDLAAGGLIQADAIDFLERRRHFTGFAQLAALAVDAEHA